MRSKYGIGDQASGRLVMRPQCVSGLRLVGVWRYVCRGPDGRVKWTHTEKNLIVDEGAIFIHNQGLGAGARYIGLKGSGVPAPGDTMGSHPSWAELTDYDEGTRQLWQIDQPVTTKTSTNAANVAVFTINASISVSGSFLTTDATKGGVSGTLIAAVDYSNGVKNPGPADSLEVTYAVTCDDDGA